MKKISVLKALATVATGAVALGGIASNANAQTVTIVATQGAALSICAATAADQVIGATASSQMGDPVTLANSFIKVGFKVKCGTNTHAYVHNGYGGSATSFAVAAGSTKGNQTYRGGASIGGVSLSAGCAVTGCAASDVTTALALAVTNGS